eukprot:9814937-Ditylum_brightwellii.AAC.1
MAATGIHDYNNRAMLQEEVIEVEDKRNSNEENDNNEESNKESVNTGCVHKVNLEGECAPSDPKLHCDAKNKLQWW